MRKPAHKYTIEFFIAILFLFSTDTAYAEGGTCPPGYYPANSPGIVACAPIPGYGGGSEPAPVGPSWVTTWGAIAAEADSGIIAGSTGQTSKRQAQKQAVNACRSKGGGKQCKVWITYHNQCAAMAVSDNYASTYSAETAEIASLHAMESCEKKSASCTIVHSNCSYPVRVR